MGPGRRFWIQLDLPREMSSPVRSHHFRISADKAQLIAQYTTGMPALEAHTGECWAKTENVTARAFRL